MIRIELTLNGTSHDVSPLLMKGTYQKQEVAMNSKRRSALSSCRFRLKYNQALAEAIENSTSKIPIKITVNNELDFLGELEPVMNLSWKRNDCINEGVEFEAVDISSMLDDYVSESASYPAVVDAPPFWIYKKGYKERSILYRLLELAGLESLIDSDSPDIPVQIRHFAFTSGEVTYRDLIDDLLSDYLYVLKQEKGRITWIPTASVSFHFPDEIKDEDLVGNVHRDMEYKNADGVRIEWSKTKVMDDALLWRGNLPIGDTSNPRPGEYIASGDYWPEDSDIEETWMNFGTEYLDRDYLEGKTRLKNKELTLLSSSDWYLKDSKEDEVILDPIDSQDIIFEALRTRFRYKNTASAARKLFYSEIHGKALIRSTIMNTTFPKNAVIPIVTKTSYIFDDSTSASRKAKAEWMFYTKGRFSFSFSSLKELNIGEVYRFENRPSLYIQILSRSSSSDSPIFTYTALSTFPFEDEEIVAKGVSPSGAQEPARDGATPRFIFKRANTRPNQPVGDNPEGWTFDRIPEGQAVLWMSMGSFSGGNLVTSWTEPVRMEGQEKGSYRGALSSFPDDAVNDDYILYTGVTTSGFIQYHLYKYVALDNIWVETTESDKVMSAQADALKIAKDSGEVIYAALLFVENLVSRKLSVGSGDLEHGILVRFLDDDGDGNVVIEARFNGAKLWWIDVDTGKMYGNFTEVVQYLPFTFNDSVDPEHPALFEFNLPEGIIDSCLVSVKAQPFRTFSKSVSFFGKVETESNRFSFGIDKITKQYNLEKSTGSFSDQTDEAGSHFHSIDPNSIPSVNTANAGGHKHSIPAYSLKESGSFDHTHKIDLSHGHNLELGIQESGMASGIKISINGAVTNISNGIRNLEIKNSVNANDWNSLSISSATIGRIQVQVLVKMRIDTTVM